MAYNPNADPYFQQVLSGQTTPSAAPPTPGGGNSFGGGLMDAGLLAGAGGGLAIAKSAWSKRGQSPESQLQDSGNTNDVPTPETIEPDGGFSGYGTVNPSALSETGTGAADILGASGEPLVESVAPSLAYKAGAAYGGSALSGLGGSLGAALGTGLGVGAAVGGGSQLGATIANAVTGQRGKYANTLGGAATSAKTFAQAAGHYDAQLHLSDLEPSQLLASAGVGTFNIAGQDTGASHSAYSYGKVFNDLLKTQGPQAAQQAINNLKSANQSATGDDKAQTTKLLGTFQQQVRQAQKSPSGNFEQTVSDQGSELANALATNGIDPHGSDAQSYVKDLTSKAMSIDKMTGITAADKKNLIQNYGASLTQNINARAQAQAFQTSLPQANQTAYQKMSMQMIKPYLDQASAQAEQSAGSLLQQAHIQAVAGNKQNAQTLMQQAVQIRSDAANQAQQAMSLAVATPRITAYDNQISSLASQLATYNHNVGSSSASQTAASLFAGNAPGST